MPNKCTCCSHRVCSFIFSCCMPKRVHGETTNVPELLTYKRTCIQSRRVANVKKSKMGTKMMGEETRLKKRRTLLAVDADVFRMLQLLPHHHWIVNFILHCVTCLLFYCIFAWRKIKKSWKGRSQFQNRIYRFSETQKRRVQIPIVTSIFGDSDCVVRVSAYNL